MRLIPRLFLTGSFSPDRAHFFPYFARQISPIGSQFCREKVASKAPGDLTPRTFLVFAVIFPSFIE
jgi:hypothetical protein